MATKINYNNKAPFQTREDIPDENKVNAEDMNEIKTAVNANADELDAAKEDIESLQGGQDAASTEITSLKNRVSTLETDNETNKTNITNLQSNKVDKVEGKGLSTEDFTTELKSKLESLENYDDTEIKEDISNLEAEQIEQNEQIDILLNALPSETAEDENINIKGAIATKFKEFKLSGNSKQETREGYNLLNVSEELEIAIFKEITVDLKANSTYTLKFENAIAGTNNNQSLITFRNTADVTSRVIDTSTIKKITVQPEQDITNIRIYASTDYTSSTGKTKTFEKLMLYKGTEDKEYEPYGAMPSPEFPSPIQNVEGDVNVTVANKEKTEQQTVTFPLAQGQKLMLGDYLAADGIHHVRKQMELDGTEDWALALTNTDTLTFQIVNNNLPVKIPNDNDEIVMISNYFKGFSRNQFNNDKETESISPNISNGSKAIIITINKTTAENLNDFKSWLAAQKQAATPVIIEYELAEEEVEAYTEEQQEAYNQICNLKAYEEETNVFSTNEISPIFKVTAVKDVNSVITQLNQLILENGGN